MSSVSNEAWPWMEQWADRFLAVASGLDDTQLGAASGLPDWTRKHVVAHVAANARAIGNLIHWARTGEKTPMYGSPQARAETIEVRMKLPRAELLDELRAADEELARDMQSLTAAQWATEVGTASGRTVPASETVWMRARELGIHAVDLHAGVGFADLPSEYLARLCREVAAKVSGGPAVELTATDLGQSWKVDGHGTPVRVKAPVADLAGYLTGRTGSGQISELHDENGQPAPALPPWL